ncbi:hypothetical protein P4U43_16645 [Arthrobacter sp. EH-1B-1]|uniref:Scaffolding protein n=1 Tax=Arthrobacter vasquezii TaxID=2977629 RepID=A0ABT6D0Y8_9MICC|nr:hypothetical protein [Arthrobacter vasquezii]MDF9279420.1 hypothetical protein [Arthrobacter vasquezii]
MSELIAADGTPEEVLPGAPAVTAHEDPKVVPEVTPAPNDAPERNLSPEPAEEEPKTFPLDYVQKLRDESAKYRQRAAKTEELGKRLHVALVEKSGRLQDASDLPYDEAFLDDPDALSAAIDALLTAKPHLASRKPSGVIPQGATATPSSGSLSGLLRRNAGL